MTGIPVGIEIYLLSVLGQSEALESLEESFYNGLRGAERSMERDRGARWRSTQLEHVSKLSNGRNNWDERMAMAISANENVLGGFAASWSVMSISSPMGTIITLCSPYRSSLYTVKGKDRHASASV